MAKEPWVFHDTPGSSVFGQIKKSLKGWNFFKDIYIKFKETELPDITWLLVSRSVETKLKSTTTNGSAFE